MQAASSYAGGFTRQSNGWLIELNFFGSVAYDRLRSVQTLELIPSLSRVDRVEIQDTQGNLLETVSPGPTGSFDESTLKIRTKKTGPITPNGQSR